MTIIAAGEFPFLNRTTQSKTYASHVNCHTNRPGSLRYQKDIYVKQMMSEYLSPTTADLQEWLYWSVIKYFPGENLSSYVPQVGVTLSDVGGNIYATIADTVGEGMGTVPAELVYRNWAITDGYNQGQEMGTISDPIPYGSANNPTQESIFPIKSISCKVSVIEDGDPIVMTAVGASSSIPLGSDYSDYGIHISVSGSAVYDIEFFSSGTWSIADNKNVPYDSLDLVDSCSNRTDADALFILPHIGMDVRVVVKTLSAGSTVTIQKLGHEQRITTYINDVEMAWTLLYAKLVAWGWSPEWAWPRAKVQPSFGYVAPEELSGSFMVELRTGLLPNTSGNWCKPLGYVMTNGETVDDFVMVQHEVTQQMCPCDMEFVDYGSYAAPDFTSAKNYYYSQNYIDYLYSDDAKKTAPKRIIPYYGGNENKVMTSGVSSMQNVAFVGLSTDAKGTSNNWALDTASPFQVKSGDVYVKGYRQRWQPDATVFSNPDTFMVDDFDGTVTVKYWRET